MAIIDVKLSQRQEPWVGVPAPCAPQPPNPGGSKSLFPQFRQELDSCSPQSWGLRRVFKVLVIALKERMIPLAKALECKGVARASPKLRARQGQGDFEQILPPF